MPESPPAMPTMPVMGPSDTKPVRESGPPVTYFRNKKGELIVVPTITIEELERLLQLDRGVPANPLPKFTFSDTVEVAAKVAGDVAEIQATFKVRFISPSGENEQEWIRIPLRFHRAILMSPLQSDGPEEMVTEYQPQGDGYVVWLNSPQATERKITLTAKVPIGTSHGEKQLLLSLPNRSTRMQLHLDSPHAEARVADESSTIDKIESTNGTTGKDLVVRSSGGTMHLVWRDEQEPPPVLQAEGAVLVRLATFDIEAQLRVRSYGAPIDSFTVRLPPGVNVLPGSNPAGASGLQISVAKGPDGQKTGQYILVRRLDGKTTGTIEVRLKAAGTNPVASQAGAVDVSGFEVVGAQIQRGTIDFMLEGDWLVDWKFDGRVRRVDVPEPLRAQQVIARFEYDQQPFSLTGVIGKGEPRVNVEPTYLVSVEPDQLKLDGSLRYRISGARAEKLLLDTGGWTIDRVAPAEMLSGQWKVENGTLELPLATGTTTGRGEFDLQIVAHQTLQPALAGSSPIGYLGVPGLVTFGPVIGEPWVRHIASDVAARDVVFSLPRPLANAATPGLVIVSPADNVELTPLTDRLRWLVADSLPSPVKLPVRQQPPLVYREDTVGQSPLFAAVLKVRRQSISVALENVVRVEEREVQIEQRVKYQIAYEPTSRLTFDMPREVWRTGELQALLEGNTLPMNPLPANGSLAPDRQLVAVELREKRIGPCELLFRYRIPRTPPTDVSASAFMASLIRPVASESTRIASCSLRLVAPSSLRVSLVDDLLRPIEDESTGVTVGNDLSFQLDQVPARISIAAMTAEGSGHRTTVIHRVWIQSLLTSAERRDRACFRLATNESHLDFILPVGAGTADIQVVVNGQRTDRPVVTEDRELRVDLGEAMGRQELTVELWYWFTAQPAALGQLHLQAPQLLGASRADRVYWELRLPANEHLVWASRNLVSENAWRWRGYYLARTPKRSQRELENWVQAAPRVEETGFNTYVFSSVGVQGPNLVITAIRPFATLAVAGGIFAVGVLLLYVPALRHPLLLAAGGLALAVVAIGYPEPCLAAAQVIALGVSLVILVRLLMGILSRQPTARLPARGSTIGLSETRSSNATLRRPEHRVDSGSGVGTATLTTPLQMSATGNEP